MDEEGRNLPGFPAALNYARICARDIMAGEVATGVLCLSCHIEIIHSESGTMRKLAFADALKLTGQNAPA